MVRIIFILVLFLLVTIPLWIILKKVFNRVNAELRSQPDDFNLNELKQKKKVLGRELVEQEKELKRAQKKNEKIKKELKDGF